MAIIPLQIATTDNTAITGDSINFTCDGANLASGGATDLRVKNKLSYTVTAQIAVTPYGIAGVNAPLPVLYPPQTFYVNGAPVVL